MYAYNNTKGQRIRTGADGVAVDRAFVAHYAISAADAAAVDDDGILVATALGAEAQDITENLNAPAVPRNLVIKGNVSGINKKVTIEGLNVAGEEISEDITPNGTSVVPGAKAFASVTKVVLPVQNHTPTAQVETATAAGTVTTAGNAKVTVTSNLFDEDEVVAVPVELNDNASAIALAIRTALEANELVSEHFDVGGETAAVILTAKIPAANDTTLNIAISDGDGEGASEGVTTADTSANTTPGVAFDTISVGWGDIFGIPYRLTADELVILKLFNNAVDAGTVAVNAEDIESNTFDVAGTVDGEKPIDLYILV